MPTGYTAILIELVLGFMGRTKKMIKYVSIFSITIFAFTFSGYSSHRKELTTYELNILIYGPKGELSSMWRGSYYQGTKEGFHCFIHKIELNRDILIKVEESRLPISQKFDFTEDESKWVDARDYVSRAEIDDRTEMLNP